MRLLPPSLFLVSVLLLAAPLPACTIQPGQSAQPFSIPEIRWMPDQDASLSYGVLLLDQGLRADDAAMILEGAQALAELSPTSQPFVDAAAWMLLNRFPVMAREVLAPALRRFPEDMNIHMLMAEAWLNDNAFDDAEAVIKSYQARYPDSIKIRHELGVLYAKAERNAEAVAVFEALSPGSFSAFSRYCYAKALSGLGRNGDSLAQLRLTVADMPEFIEAWMELARLLETEGDYTQAASIYEEQILEQDPHNALAWMRLIGVYLRSGDRVSALDVAKNCTDFPAVIFSAVSLFLEERCYDEAEALLASMLQQPKSPEEAYFYMALTIYEGKRDLAGALGWLDRVTSANRFYAQALHLRSQIFAEQKQYEKSLAELVAARGVLPQEFSLALMQAHVLNQLKRHDEAVSVLDQAIKTWPDALELHYSKGMSLELAGRKDEAMRQMESLIAENPEYYQALNYIGYALAEQNRDLPRALELLIKADALSPDTGYILDSLAWAQFRAGQIEAAWGNIRRAVELEDGQDSVIWEHYGDIARAAGQPDQAREGYRKALEAGHEQPEAVRNKMRQIP